MTGPASSMVKCIILVCLDNDDYDEEDDDDEKDDEAGDDDDEEEEEETQEEGGLINCNGRYLRSGRNLDTHLAHWTCNQTVTLDKDCNTNLKNLKKKNPNISCTHLTYRTCNDCNACDVNYDELNIDVKRTSEQILIAPTNNDGRSGLQLAWIVSLEMQTGGNRFLWRKTEV